MLLPGKSNGQRSLVGYSPWGHKESDMTEWLTLYSWYYYTNSTSDHQALDPRSWGPLLPFPSLLLTFCFPSLTPWREKPLNKIFSFKLHLMTIKKNFGASSHRVSTLRNMNFGFPSLDRKRNMFILPNESPHSENRQNVFGSSHNEKAQVELLCLILHIYVLAWGRSMSRKEKKKKFWSQAGLS